MKNIAILRDRGQLTIPESIRETVPWLTKSAVVNIYLKNSQEIRILPHRAGTHLNWNKILKGIQRIRKYPNKQKKLSAFIEQDRERI